MLNTVAATRSATRKMTMTTTAQTGSPELLKDSEDVVAELNNEIIRSVN